MAKKITFLLVIVSVLVLTSLTAFAGNTQSADPQTGFTKEKTDSILGISISDLETKYEEIFFSDTSKSDKVFIDISYSREKDAQSQLRYNFTGSVVDSSSSPAIMLMYIKKEGVYVPLNSVETGSNIAEGTLVTCSKVDLAYLGSDRVNDVRIIVFKKDDINNLELNKNLQITDLSITVRPWNWIEKVNIKLNELINSLAPAAQ